MVSSRRYGFDKVCADCVEIELNFLFKPSKEPIDIEVQI